MDTTANQNETIKRNIRQNSLDTKTVDAKGIMIPQGVSLSRNPYWLRKVRTHIIAILGVVIIILLVQKAFTLWSDESCKDNKKEIAAYLLGAIAATVAFIKCIYPHLAPWNRDYRYRFTGLGETEARSEKKNELEQHQVVKDTNVIGNRDSI